MFCQNSLIFFYGKTEFPFFEIPIFRFCRFLLQGLTHPDGWKWGGCSDNVEYGIWFSRTFVDAPDAIRVTQSGKDGDIHSLVNLHNNEAGRQVRRPCYFHINLFSAGADFFRLLGGFVSFRRVLAFTEGPD